MLGYVKWILIFFALALAGAIIYRIISGDLFFSDDFLRVMYRFYLVLLYGAALLLIWKLISSRATGWSFFNIGKPPLSTKAVRVFTALPQILFVLIAMIVSHVIINFILFGDVRLESFWRPPW